MPEKQDGQEPIDIAKTQQSIREGLARAAELVDRARRLVREADAAAEPARPPNGSSSA